MTNFENLCTEYRENKRLIEELQAMNDSIKAAILAIMGDRETVIEGASKATNKTVTSSRFDSSGFKKEYPGTIHGITAPDNLQAVHGGMKGGGKHDFTLRSCFPVRSICRTAENE